MQLLVPHCRPDEVLDIQSECVLVSTMVQLPMNETLTNKPPQNDCHAGAV